MDLENPSDLAVLIALALDHETDGEVYGGKCVGCLSWDGDDLLVPVVSEDESRAGNFMVCHAPTVYRVKIERIKP